MDGKSIARKVVRVARRRSGKGFLLTLQCGHVRLTGPRMSPPMVGALAGCPFCRVGDMELN